MYQSTHTLDDAHLTKATLAHMLCGLGLSTSVRCKVNRACRQLSRNNSQGTVSSRFSPYNDGAAPTFAELRDLLGDPQSAIRQQLTVTEVRACRRFIDVRSSVRYRPIDYRPRPSGGRPPLHSFGDPRRLQPDRYLF